MKCITTYVHAHRGTRRAHTPKTVANPGNPYPYPLVWSQMEGPAIDPPGGLTAGPAPCYLTACAATLFRAVSTAPASVRRNRVNEDASAPMVALALPM